MVILTPEITPFYEALNNIQEELSELKKSNEKFKHIVEGISAREIGKRAEDKALNFIFPGCRQKPFGLRSLNNLCTFVKNPSKCVKDGNCMPSAVNAWDNNPDEWRDETKNRLNTFLQDHPGILYSLKTLQNLWFHYHNITSIGECLAYYRGRDDTVADALEKCIRLIEESTCV